MQEAKRTAVLLMSRMSAHARVSVPGFRSICNIPGVLNEMCLPPEGTGTGSVFWCDSSPELMHVMLHESAERIAWVRV